MSSKRLERSARNKVLAGVIGGLGEYLGVDATLLRIVAVILLILSPVLMIIFYVLGVLLMPRAGEEKPPIASFDISRHASLIVGLILVIIGAAMLGSATALTISWILHPVGIIHAIQAALAIVLIIIGLVIMLPSLKRL
ncbi:MAG: PspC domain-containing protein [Aigarchaeota archaeon]|nr:PspC domain-containing protein [Candidatus Wolframiiraptor gerlachensis]